MGLRNSGWPLTGVILLATACGPGAADEFARGRSGGAAQARGPATATATPAVAAASGRQRAEVVRVTDGDTIRVRLEGREVAVRYIGIDTPETVDPRRSVQCFGLEATAANKRLVEGRTVELEKDVSETDRFDRLLRYVYVDGKLANEELVSGGFARSSAYPPDVRHQARLTAAEAAARTAGRGLWAENACPAAPTATPVRTVVPAASASARASCDPSYPTVCIARFPPDLDCGQIPFRRFPVLQPDPHRLDGNRDGIGCE